MQEEIRKNPALAKKMEMAAMEEELEKECRDITDRLRMQEEQEIEWLAGGGGGDVNAPCVDEEVDMS
ncbi:hypothetical protein I312_105632 [Cryptococcus bacillisporus CA1280]|uniref:uncharacterized protein n=1 Tax=Cryptococcus bacillisporus CA1280 TaxID=1296109 RepID=UPI00336708F2